MSKWYYLLPLVLGIFGGIIAWYRVRKTDSYQARNLIIVGGVVSLISLFLTDMGF